MGLSLRLASFGPPRSGPTNQCKTERLADTPQRDLDAEPVAEPRLGLADQLSPARVGIAVGLSGVAHLICATGLLAAMGRLEPHVTPAALAVVLTTLAVALWRANRTPRLPDGSGIDLATLRAPSAFAAVPPLVTVAVALPWTAALERGGLEAAALDTVPILAATTAPGIAIALVLEYSLWTVVARVGQAQALARRAGKASAPAPRAGEDPPTPPRLADRLVRLVVGLGLASGLLVLAHGLVEFGPPRVWLGHPATWVAMLGATASLVLAGLAAASAGLSPGRDVAALATRLDAIGWDEHPEPGASSSEHGAARPLAAPVRVTSFDAVGELFRELERLRARLADEVGTYQTALDRTREADTAKREFLAAVSHELRTPLDSILAEAQALLAGPLTDAQAEDVRLIVTGDRQLCELIDDILDVSMIESGELQLRFAACDLAGLVDELVDIHRAQIRSPEVTLAAERPAELAPVVCDRKRIGQVLTNLLSNAIKFTEAGRVCARVVAEPDAERIRVEIVDTGVGIAEAELASIFEEYQQVGARKRKLRGTGLGLAIARRIAEAHGGTLTARSELGRGSTFTLELPRLPPDPEPDADPSREERGG